MDNKSILITGCSSGIGEHVSEALWQRGYRVFASARRPEDVESLKAAGLNALQLDLDDCDSINTAVDEVLSQTGGTLYALFNNAAYGQAGAVEDLSREARRAQFETNLFGTIELTNRIIPIMRQQGYGRIIQNSSLLGYVALAYRGAYNASKYALKGLSDTLRLELMDSNIFVSLVEPGPIESRFRANAWKTFKQHIDKESSFHSDKYRIIEARLQKEGPVAPFTLPPSAVLDKVVHALESKRPKNHYPVTVPAHLFAWCRRLLPTRLLDRILVKI